MATHSVLNPLAVLARKSPTTVFENPLSKAHTVHHNPLEKYKQTIDDLVAVTAKDASDYFYTKTNAKNTIKNRCENMDSTIRDIVDIYIKRDSDTHKLISDEVSDKIISSCRNHGILSVQRMISAIDENGDRIRARLRKLKATGGGTRKSIRRRSRTRRYKR